MPRWIALMPTVSEDQRMANISLRLTARQWATIDAILDNATQDAVDLGGDPEPTIEIRKAGWDQVPWVGDGKDWPPMSEIIAINLARDQWRLVVSHLVEHNDLLDDQQELESGRDALRTITEQLGQR